MKRLKIPFFFLSTIIILQSCNSGETKETTSTADSISNSSAMTIDSSRMAPNSMDANKIDSSKMGSTLSQPVDADSKNFAMKAASGGMMEVEAGKLAQQNAKSQRIKDFGTMLVTDHGKANDELKSLAFSNNVTLPTAMMPEQQKHIDMMGKMKGADFDKHFIDMMVNDHKKDIGEFKKEANNSKNDAFKNFAAKTLPTLQAHLDSAQAIHGKM